MRNDESIKTVKQLDIPVKGKGCKESPVKEKFLLVARKQQKNYAEACTYFTIFWWILLNASNKTEGIPWNRIAV